MTKTHVQEDGRVTPMRQPPWSLKVLFPAVSPGPLQRNAISCPFSQMCARARRHRSADVRDAGEKS